MTYRLLQEVDHEIKEGGLPCKQDEMSCQVLQTREVTVVEREPDFVGNLAQPGIHAREHQ